MNLTPTSYLVLGLLAAFGPSTPYDLKRLVGMSIGHFWSFPHSQLYAEPERLAEAGLLEMEQEPRGRRRKRYTITEEGEEALAAWLSDPTPEPGEIRAPGLLKLFFGGLAEPEDVVAFAQGQLEAYRRGLDELEAIEADVKDVPGTAYPVKTLELGKRVTRVYVDFWSEILEQEAAELAPDAGPSRVAGAPRPRGRRRRRGGPPRTPG